MCKLLTGPAPVPEVTFSGIAKVGNLVRMQLNFFEHLHMAEVQNLATAAPAPEPAASALMMAGLAGVGGLARRRTHDPRRG